MDIKNKKCSCDVSCFIVTIILIIITAISVGSLVYYWQSSLAKIEKEQLQQQIDNLNRSLQEINNKDVNYDIKEDMSNWKTFINKTYKYQVSYPGDLQIGQHMGKDYNLTIEQLLINVTTYDRSLEQYVTDRHANAQQLEKDIINFEGYPAIKVTEYNHTGYGTLTGIYFKKDDYIFEIRYSYKTKEEEALLTTYEKIIQSFKFID